MGWEGPFSRPGVVLLCALVLLPAQLAAGQMVTPLQGQGQPGNATREVFMSVYLDRLLGVDDINYRFEAVFYFYLTWRDPGAYDTVRNMTARMRAGNHTCQRPCSDWVAAHSCCDGIWQPTFFFRNAFGFPQDRATGYKLYAVPAPQGSMLWTQFTHVVAYQPMDLRYFPLDSWDLLLALEFLDTAPPGHPGVTVRLSSGSPKLYTYGRGDAVSQWSVDGISMKTLKVDSVAWFKANSEVPSDPDDPLGLTSSDAAMLRGCPPGATTIQDSRNVTMVVINVRITRFWRYAVLNCVLPVLLVGGISFVVFWIDRKEMATRLGLVVTLYLALAAVQFVVAGQLPATGYAVPVQQLVVTVYILLSLIAVESIVVYHVMFWKQLSSEAAERRRACNKYLAERRAAKAAAEAVAEANAQTADGGDRATEQGLGMEPRLGFPARQHVVRFFDQPAEDKGGAQHTQADACGRAAPRLQTRCLTRSESLRQDEAYDSYVAYVLDRTALVLLFVGYILAVTLILALQSGYIDLFA